MVEDGAVLAAAPTDAFTRDGAFEECVMVRWLQRMLPAHQLGGQVRCVGTSRQTPPTVCMCRRKLQAAMMMKLMRVRNVAEHTHTSTCAT